MSRSLNSTTLEELMSVAGGPGATVLGGITSERERFGQFLTWSDVEKRVPGLGFKNIVILRQAGYEVRPTLSGLLRDLDNLSQEAFQAKNLRSSTVQRIMLVRGDPGFKALQSVRLVRGALKASAWQDVAAHLLGGMEALLGVELLSRGSQGDGQEFSSSSERRESGSSGFSRPSSDTGDDDDIPACAAFPRNGRIVSPLNLPVVGPMDVPAISSSQAIMVDA